MKIAMLSNISIAIINNKLNLLRFFVVFGRELL